MKLSDILLLSLFIVMGAMIFAVKKMQSDNGGDVLAIAVPALNQDTLPLTQTKTPSLRLELSVPVDAGSHGRLSLDEFLAKTPPSAKTDQVAPKNTIKKISAPKNITTEDPVNNSVIKRPRNHTGHDQASIMHQPNIQLSNLEVETADAINLPYLPEIGETRFVDRVAKMAEASPVQPDARGCGTLSSDLKSAPKHAKVRSIAMERQLTGRTSIGVEYVYKDGCYKNAIAPLNAHDMPGDDGVNLRVNMRF